MKNKVTAIEDQKEKVVKIKKTFSKFKITVEPLGFLFVAGSFIQVALLFCTSIVL